LLCLQEEIAESVLTMLRGAMQELHVGHPDRLECDVGPVIDADAANAIETHISSMQTAGHRIERQAIASTLQHGNFVAPTLIEIDHPGQLAQEVFGPVLHVVRYQRTALDSLIDAINATGYGLTFGLHTRIDETIEQVVSRVKAGNVYINRNTVGAVVGVQPFGGEGLSGTGPKAGGPLYLARLLSQGPSPKLLVERPSILQGPTGERNTYHHLPRGTVLCIACTPQGAAAQWRAVQATGNMALWIANEVTRSFVTTLGDEHQRRCRITDAPVETLTFNAVLFEGDADALGAFHEQLVARDGPLIPVQGLAPDEAAAYGYAAERLVLERCVTINTAAAGGNASLMSIG
jgi:RHH-type proline utilization regulon transcriptional repressor/proline dehydrogenase/delta 1-pyrroline-5-carboxylate dehydrogenase